MPRGGKTLGQQARWVQRRGRESLARYVFLARLPRRGVGVEVGSWKGDFAAKLLRWTRPQRLFLVDPWRHTDSADYAHAMYGQSGGGQEEMDGIYESVRRRFGREIDSGKVVVMREDSLAAAKDWSEGMFDWAYIDGDHTYAAVRDDLEAYWPLVRPGGVLAGDDYGFPGWWDDGVTRAADEFAAARKLRLNVIGSQFLVRKPA